MRRRNALTAAAVGIALSAVAIGSGLPARGYLGDRTIDLVRILPPAPVPGDPRYDADRAIFRRTRALAGSDRYRMARDDVSEDARDLLADFSCAADIALSPERAPHTTALLVRASIDTAAQNDRAKRFYRRQRPFMLDTGEICQPRPLTVNLDYPSGHTTRGWTWALILSDLLPARATPILARGRAYGESRFVCGAHNESAVEAGRLSATVTMQAVRQSLAYQQDLRRARAELARLPQTASTPSWTCPVKVERHLLSVTRFVRTARG